MVADREAPNLLLAEHLKKLKLPALLREYETQARQCAAENRANVQLRTKGTYPI